MNIYVQAVVDVGEILFQGAVDTASILPATEGQPPQL